MMTEREAWEALAVDAGRERSRLERGIVGAIGITYNGLCGGLDRLSLTDDAARKVSAAVRYRMMARIQRELRAPQRRRVGGETLEYLWPLTPSGFKRRAAWARKQAAR